MVARAPGAHAARHLLRWASEATDGDAGEQPPTRPCTPQRVGDHDDESEGVSLIGVSPDVAHSDEPLAATATPGAESAGTSRRPRCRQLCSASPLVFHL